MTNNPHGWLVLDKPPGITSAQAAAKVKNIVARATCRGLKIGHAGTLDPLASGVLPLALGEATKTVQFAMDQAKAYRFTVAFGEERDTGDAEGAVTARSAVRPSEAEIKAVLKRFAGEVWQRPPAYSAIKIKGQRAYALARAGEAVEPAARQVRIDLIQLTDFDGDNATFQVTCGKGTYIRSLAVDISRALGTAGHVYALRRLKVGRFGEADAISLENLEKIVHNGGLATVLHPVESVLADIPAREVSSTQALRLRQGQAVSGVSRETKAESRFARAMCGGVLVAVCTVGPGLMKPVRVFNLSA